MNKQVRPGEQTDTLRRHTGEVRWHKMNSGGIWMESDGQTGEVR